MLVVSMLDDTATLFEGSKVTIAEAKRLTEINVEWQLRISCAIHQIWGESF